MKTNTLVMPVLFVLALLAGCDSGQDKRVVFVCPQGDAARGQKAFVELKCYECHRVAGVPGLPAPTLAQDKVVPLGGEVYRVRTYGELVTAVIHPSYAKTMPVSGEDDKPVSMPRYNDTMTVAQMLDIVAFLYPRYEHIKPLYSDRLYGP